MSNVFRAVEDHIKWRITFTKSPVCLAVVSRTGKFLECNESFCHLLSYTSSELESRDYQHITHPDDLSQDEFMVEQMLLGKIDEYSMVKRYLSKLGKIVPVKIVVKSVVEGGSFICFFVAIIPIEMASNEKFERPDENALLRKPFNLSDFLIKNWQVILPWVFTAVSVGITWYMNGHDQNRDLQRDVELLKTMIEKLQKN